MRGLQKSCRIQHPFTDHRSVSIEFQCGDYVPQHCHVIVSDTKGGPHANTNVSLANERLGHRSQIISFCPLHMDTEHHIGSSLQ